MTNPAHFEELVHRLAYIIDPDRPPGIAAQNLARAAVALVRDRSGAQGVALEQALNRLAMSARFARVPARKRDSWGNRISSCPVYGIVDEPEPPTEPDGGRRLSSPRPEALSGGPEVSTRPPMLLGPEGPVREAPGGGPVPEGHEGGIEDPDWVQLDVIPAGRNGLPQSRRIVCDFLSEEGSCDGESAACEGCPKRGA